MTLERKASSGLVVRFTVKLDTKKIRIKIKERGGEKRR